MAESTEVSLPPAAKRRKRNCHFDSKWIKDFQGISRSSKGS